MSQLKLPANGAALAAFVFGAVGAGLGFGPKIIYGFALALGVLAITFAVLARQRALRDPKVGGDVLLIVAAALGVLAVGLGLYKGFTVEEADEDAGPLTLAEEAAARDDREVFCDSDAGDELLRAASAALESADALRQATEDALAAAEDAPAGAYCAVNALDSIADTWNVRSGDPDYEDAEDEVNRIRDFQEENNLRQPEF